MHAMSGLMRGVIYCRVSTKEQVRNLSLPTQLQRCLDYCKRNNIEPVEVFEDAGESAKTTDRADFQRLLEYCRTNKGRVRCVVVYNVTRFARNLKDHVFVRAQLLSYGVTLRSAIEPIGDDPAGKLTGHVLSAFAEFENDQKAERTKAGMRAALERGRWTWLAPPGYTNGNTKLGAPSLLPDVESGPLMTSGFEMVATGNYTSTEVLRKLTALGLRARKGRPLSLQTFTALLKKRIYIGLIDAPGFGIKGIKGDFTPLVSETVFQRVQAVLRGHTGPATHHLDHPDFPLRRFVACDRCGRPLTGSEPRGRTKTYPYYHCRKCRGVSIRREALHGLFLDLLDTLRPRPEYLELFRAIVLDVWRVRTAEAGALRMALEEKLTKLQDREALLNRAFIYERKIDSTTYQSERDAIREQIALGTVELDDARHDEADVEHLVAFAEHVLTNAARLWTEAKPEQKTLLQRSLFPEGLRLRDGKIGTAATCMAFMHLRKNENGKSELASPTGARETYETGHRETYELPLSGTVHKAA